MSARKAFFEGTTDERLWRCGELARYLGTTPGTVRVKVSKRQIPFLKIGRSVRFSPSALEEWLASKAVPPQEVA